MLNENENPKKVIFKKNKASHLYLVNLNEIFYFFLDNMGESPENVLGDS
jgi:hypothetical protein